MFALVSYSLLGYHLKLHYLLLLTKKKSCIINIFCKKQTNKKSCGLALDDTHAHFGQLKHLTVYYLLEAALDVKPVVLALSMKLSRRIIFACYTSNTACIAAFWTMFASLSRNILWHWDFLRAPSITWSAMTILHIHEPICETHLTDQFPLNGLIVLWTLGWFNMKSWSCDHYEPIQHERILYHWL